MITNHLFRSSEYKFSLFASFCTANHYRHVAPYSAVSNTKVLCTPLHRGGCQRRIAKACLGTGCVGGRLKAVCLVPEFEITRSGRGVQKIKNHNSDFVKKIMNLKHLINYKSNL